MTLSVTAPRKADLNECSGHLTSGPYQRTWLPCPNMLRNHWDGFGPGWKMREVSTQVVVYIDLHNVLNYFARALLTDAGVNCCCFYR